MLKIENEKDWHKARAKGIGGSDAACILGLNPWKTNVQLWEEKTGRKQAADISDKECVQYGKKAEEHIRGLFELDYPQYRVFADPFKMQQNKNHLFIIGTLDGVIWTDNPDNNGILEIKTTTIQRSADWEKWNGQVPQNYYCQILHYFLTNEAFKFAYLRALIKSTNNNGETISTIKDYQINRDEVKDDLDHLLNKEIEFWRYVEQDKRPPLVLPPI